MDGAPGRQAARMVGGGATHAGNVRPHNEDGMLVSDTLGLFAVADGMGGHKAGEVASALALEAIDGFIVRGSESDDHTWPFGLEAALDRNGNRVRTAVKLANRRVFRESERRDEYSGMGTTVALVLVDDSSAVVCGVGDSRVYLITGSDVRRLTQDHTWVETLLAQNPGLDRATLANHPMRHVLTNVVGAQDDLDVPVTTHVLKPGDRLLLCTDGVHGALDDETLGRLVCGGGTATQAAERVVAEALLRDGRDNLTAVVVERAS